MDQLSDEILSNSDVNAALRNIAHRGLQEPGGKTRGFQEMLEQLRRRRQETLDRYDLASVLDEIQNKIESVLRREEQGVKRQLHRARSMGRHGPQGQGPGLDSETVTRLLEGVERRARASRDALRRVPRDNLAGAIEQLRDYEFTDPQAKQEFEELLSMLRQQAAESLFKDLSRSLRGMGPGQVRSLKHMLRDLNRMLEDRLQGRQPDFQQFMDRHGNMFGPPPPADLDRLIERMQHRIAQMRSLLESLAPEQRRSLEDLMRAALADPDLRRDIDRLSAAMECLDPMGGLEREYPFMGKEPLDLSEALQVMERLQSIDHMEKDLRAARQGGNIQDVDPGMLRDLLGEEARQDLERLAGMPDILEAAGYIRKAGDHFELTPRGMRRIGQRALREIFAYIKKDRPGQHMSVSLGQGVEHAETTRAWEFGDPFLPHIQRTLLNASLRHAGGLPLKLLPDDFEIYETEQMAQAATVLMLDLSLSMAMRGNFMAAKKVALALDNLIRTRFPRDKLYIVGFSTYAREMKPDCLAYLSWDEFEPYTNIQHGLLLSQRLLSRVKGGTKQINMISDGEPTAHMEGGQVFLQYPPSPRTIRQTLAEVRRCTQQGITINTFMLDRNTYLVDFVEQMTRLNRGRVFYTTAERLGKYLLVDYLGNRRKKIAI